MSLRFCASRPHQAPNNAKPAALYATIPRYCRMRVDFVGGARRNRDGFENLGPRRPPSRNLSFKEPSNRRIFAAQSSYNSITDGILSVRSNMEAARRAERERRMVRKALGVCLGSILIVCVGIGCASALLPATSTAAPVTNAATANTVSGSAAGVPATLTTYNTPGYVTVSAYGQSIDLAVPAAAQQYLPLIACANR